MNKKNLTNLLWLIILTTLFFMIKPHAEAFWACFRDFTNPRYYDVKLKAWSNESTDFLIGKLGHPSPTWDGAASNILAKRKDLSKRDKIIQIIQSTANTKKRSSALRVLFFWDEEIAFDISMQILRSGKENPLYDSALGKLSYRQYAPAYPYVVDLAKAPEKFNNGSISLLEKFGRSESIPILEDMLKHVKHKDPVIASLYTGSIQDAIRSIKERNHITA